MEYIKHGLIGTSASFILVVQN